MLDRGLSVETVEVQDIDIASWEPFESGVEAAPQQLRERFVMCPIVRSDLDKGRFVVAAGMLVTAPRIDCETARREFGFGNRLTEREVAFSAIDAELDDQLRLQQRDEVVAEVQVIRPRADAVDARLEVARR